jgi:ribonuclease Z
MDGRVASWPIGGRTQVSVRELVVLGTASQVPTRTRAHHGALLRFERHGILLDPGEGTQRQLTHAGISASTITRICITHAHGDHCLGLPGVLQRLSLDGVTRPVEVHHPVAAGPYVERLRSASAYEDVCDVRLRPEQPGLVADADGLRIRAAALSHAIPTLGWRFEEPDGRTLLPDRLEALGIHGAQRSELVLAGSIRSGGRTVHLEEVSVARPGQTVAVVMDTRWCEGALELADGVDLLLVEATFLSGERELAEASGHLTAGQAAELAHVAGARRVVLTHLSQRYPDPDGHLEEARAAAPGLDLRVAADLDRIPLPARVRGRARGR